MQQVDDNKVGREIKLVVPMVWLSAPTDLPIHTLS